MKIPKSLYLLPSVPIFGAVIRHYSPEFIDDNVWMASGFIVLICCIIIMAIDFDNESNL